MFCWKYGNVVLGHRAVTSAVGITHSFGVFAGMFCWKYGNVVLGSRSCWHHVGVIWEEVHLQGCSVGMTGMLLCWGHVDIMSTVGCWHHTQMLLERRCVSRNVVLGSQSCYLSCWHHTQMLLERRCICRHVCVGSMGMLCRGHRAVTSAVSIMHMLLERCVHQMFCWYDRNVVVLGSWRCFVSCWCHTQMLLERRCIHQMFCWHDKNVVVLGSQRCQLLASGRCCCIFCE